MKFTCDKCGAQYKIKDEKIGPNGVSVRCKKCDHKIIVRLPKKEEPAQQFPEFPVEGNGSDFPSDMEATRQLANPLLDIQKSESGVSSSKPAPAEPKAEKKPEQKAEQPASKADEFGLDSPSGSVVSSLPFDLGLGKDEDLGKALDPVLGDKPADDSPFSASFGTDDGGSEPDEGNATRVVNLAAMASLMKAAASPQESAAPASSSAADEGESGASEPAASPAAPGEEWYVAIDGQQQGPMDFDGVKAHWDKGEISTDSLVWNPSMPDWAALGTVPELSKKLEPPKPAMSDIPAAASSSPALDEWGLPVAADAAGSSPSGAPAASAAATLPSPQAAPEEPVWKPAAASMLSSLLQDEMSALEAPKPAPAPAPVPAASSLLPAIAGPESGALPVAAALPQPSAAPSGVLPDLAPMPAPSSIPAPSQDEFQLPPPPSAGMDAGGGFGGFPPPMDQNSDGPLPGIGADPQNGRDATEPGGFSGNMDDAPSAWEVPAPALPRSSPSRNRQGGGRRQGEGNGRRAHQMPVQQLPQMPSRMPGAVKGAIGIGVVILLIVVTLVIGKYLLPSTTTGDAPVVAENQAAPATLPTAAPVNPAQPSPAPAATPGEPATATANPAASPAAAAVAAPAAPEKPAATAAATPSAPAAEPAKAAPEPAEKKEKAAPPPKKAKKVTRKKGGAKARAVAAADDEDDDEYEEEDDAPAPVAAAPEPPKPAPEPAKPEPSSKVDDDFERLFGGGGSSAAAEPAKPAPAKKPTVYVPPPTGVAAKATLSQSDIMGEVMKHRGDIKRCTDDEEDSGTIVMSWTIQKSGKPSNVKTDTGDYKGSDLEHCLKGVINSMKFPPYSGDQMQPIKFPFRF